MVKSSGVNTTAVCRSFQTAVTLFSAGNITKNLPFLKILLSKLKPSKGSLSSAEGNHWKESGHCSVIGEFIFVLLGLGYFFTHVLLQNHSTEFKDNLKKLFLQGIFFPL